MAHTTRSFTANPWLYRVHIADDPEGTRNLRTCAVAWESSDEGMDGALNHADQLSLVLPADQWALVTYNGQIIYAA